MGGERGGAITKVALQCLPGGGERGYFSISGRGERRCHNQGSSPGSARWRREETSPLVGGEGERVQMKESEKGVLAISGGEGGRIPGPCSERKAGDLRVEVRGPRLVRSVEGRSSSFGSEERTSTTDSVLRGTQGGGRWLTRLVT